MKFLYLTVPALVSALSACSTQIGGDGQLSNGEPLSVIMQVDMTAANAVTVIDIMSLDGWTCRAHLADEGQKGLRQSYPLTCSDGANGTLITTWDNIQKRQHGAFKLNNGRSGKIDFDFKK